MARETDFQELREAKAAAQQYANEDLHPWVIVMGDDVEYVVEPEDPSRPKCGIRVLPQND